MAKIKNLEMSEGEHWVIHLNARDENRVPFDLSGGSATWEIFDFQGNTVSLFVGEIIDAEAGLADFIISPVDHQDISSGQYSYQLSVELSDLSASVQFRGQMTVNRSPHGLGLHGGGGGTSVIMAGSSGSYLINGSTAVLLIRTNPLIAGSASYALSGVSATFGATRVAVAGSSSYTITGASAGLVRRVASLVAGNGSYAVSGSSAGLQLGSRQLVAGASSYAISGSVATLNGRRQMIADGATYALTGTSPSLTKSRAVVAGSSSYAITGSATALLIKGRSLAAGGGSYAITGSNATHVRGRKIAAATSSYAITGSSVTLDQIIINPGDDVASIVNAAAAGATFYFNSGTYRQVSLTPKNNQTFIGATGAIFNGSAVLSSWSLVSGKYVASGQTQAGTVHPTASFEAGTERPGYPETLFMDDVPLRPVDSLAHVVSGTFFLDYSAHTITIADNPSGHVMEAGKVQYAFQGSASGVTIENLIIEKYDPSIQDGAIKARLGNGWLIQDCEVRLCYAAGICIGNNCQVVDCHVHDCGQLGIGGDGDNMLLQGTEINDCGYWSFIDPLWEGGGNKFGGTDGTIYRGNYAHDNKGTGLWTDESCVNILYEDNVLARNTINGISHEIGYDCVIRNNTFIGNGYGDTRGWGFGVNINIQNSKNVQVFGNRVEMLVQGHGIVMIQQDRGTGSLGVHLTTNNNIHDNVVVDAGFTGINGGFVDFGSIIGVGNIWVNNAYHMSDVSRFTWNGGYINFTAFKTATGETGTRDTSYPDTSTWENWP